MKTANGNGIHIADYSSQQQASWNGWYSTFLIGGGYQWALNNAITMGPLTTLNYTPLFRPAITESGQAATRLSLAANRFHSLQASTGIKSNFVLHETLQASLKLSWKQELLANSLGQNATFVANQPSTPTTAFNNTNAVAQRQAVHLQFWLTHKWNKYLTLETQGSTHFFRPGLSRLFG